MGGHAFGTILGPSAIFPRMNPTTYERLRTYVMRLLTPRFSSPVVVAREDPAKVDFGDLDVCVLTDSYLGASGDDEGKEGVEGSTGRPNLKEELRILLGAERAVSNGSGFMSFAIAGSTLNMHIPHASVQEESPVASINAAAIPADPTQSNPATENADAMIYHQVDINLAKSQDEIEALPFYSSYGDLGMILALMCKTLGMSYSVHGLKIVLHSYTSRIERQFLLSTSTPAILSFLGFDYFIWKRGFITRTEIFEWIMSSRLAHPAAILGVSPKHLDRPMYREFVRHVETLQQQQKQDEATPQTIGENNAAPPDPDEVVQKALEFFGRTEEYNTLAKAVEQRKMVKQVLNGKLVQEVAGLQGAVVGRIIATVKEMATPEELVAMPEEKIRGMILKVSRVAMASEESSVALDSR